MKKLYILPIIFLLGLFVSMDTQAQVNISNGTDTTCSNTLFDSGGPSSNYGANENFHFVIDPSGVSSISIVFDSLGLNDGDTLRIHDGSDTTGAILATLFAGSPTALYTSTGGVVTIHFTTDADSVDYGWSLQWSSTLTTTPSVSISASINTICLGDAVTFSVTDSTGGGFDPVFQWYHNLTPVGTDLHTFMTTGLANADSVWVEMTQSSCPQNQYKDTSNAEVFVVNPNITPNVSITATSTSVCSSDSIIFYVTDSSNAGNPDFEWKVNGVTAGGNIDTFYLATPVNGDQVRVVMTAEPGGCYTDDKDSTSLTISVTSNIVPNVSISANDPSVCSGTSVVYTVTDSSNAGNPDFAWFVNVTPAGTNTYYLSNTPSNNDSISVIMTAEAGSCYSKPSDTAWVIMNVNPSLSASISGSNDLTCPLEADGDATASSTGGTGTKYYLWDDPLAQTTQTADSLLSGTYLVTISDDSSCFDTASVFIDQPTPFSISFTVTNVTTFGGNNGKILAVVSGGTGNIDHRWSNGASRNNNNSHQINNLSSDWYTDTIYDNVGCKYMDSAFVDQPGQLLGGSIRINGTTSKIICEGDIVGLLTNFTSGSGGIGGTSYTWQYSNNLLTWFDYPSSNTTTYTVNSSISEITFIRRIITDAVFDTVASNTIFLNYIPPATMSIIGLNSPYCDNESAFQIFGSPAGSGGNFTSTPYIDTATNFFSPALSASDTLGKYNNITYNYTDNYGCVNVFSDSVLVYFSDTGHINMPNNQYFFDPSEPAATINNTYPGGTFTGPGVVSSTDTSGNPVVTFDPSLVTNWPVDVVINFSYTNANGCTSYDTIRARVQSSAVTISSSLSSPEKFEVCYHNNTDTLFAKIPFGVTVNSYRWLLNDVLTGRFYLPNPSFTAGPFTNQTIELVFDPKYAMPIGNGTVPFPYTTPGKTPTGVTRIRVYFQHYDGSNVFTNLIRNDLELVNLTSVKISPNDPNSNGTSGIPLQYCETVTNVSYTSSVFPIAGRTLEQFYTPLPGLIDNGNGNATFDPSILGPGTSSLTLNYEDSATGCRVDTSYQLIVDALPNVSIDSLPNAVCANDGVISFIGNPYISNRGFFSTTSDSLNLSQSPGSNIGSITTSASNDGKNHDIKYVFRDNTGCIDSTTKTITIHELPDISISSVDPDGGIKCGGYPNDYSKIRGLYNGATTTIIGTFFGATYGLTNQVGNDINYGQGAPDAFFTDEVFFTLQDLNGCRDTTSKTMEILKNPPSYFEIDPDGAYPMPKHLCINGQRTATTAMDTCGPACNLLWPGVISKWELNRDTSTNNWVTSKIAQEFNPGYLAGDDTTFNFFPNPTFYRHTITDSRATPACSTKFIETLYVDQLPQPDIWIDDNDYVSASGDSVICSKKDTISIRVSPPSPGITNPSVISSTNMYGGFTQQLSNTGDSVLIKSTLGLIESLNPPFKSNYNLSYVYKEPTTGCANTAQYNFDLKTSPKLIYAGPVTTEFCPYDSSQLIKLTVNGVDSFTYNDPNIINTFIGVGIEPATVNPNSNFVKFHPNQFPDSIVTNAVWNWSHADRDGCVSAVNMTGYKVNNIPILRIVKNQSVTCLEGKDWKLDAQYRDSSNTTPWDWANYQVLTGDNQTKNDAFWKYERASIGGVPIWDDPNFGPASSRFNPPEDSKDNSGSRKTAIRFKGSYPGKAGAAGSGCQATAVDTIITRARPIADFTLDGLCSKYNPVLRGDSSSIDQVFDPSDEIIGYHWFVDGNPPTLTADTNIVYTHDKTVSIGNHSFDLIVTSKYGCESAVKTIPKTFVESPDADFEWNMDGECVGNTVTFTSTSGIPATADPTYTWYFGDGDTAFTDTIDPVMHSYNAVQNFKVLLKVQDGTNCTDTITKNFLVRDILTPPYFEDFDASTGGWSVWKQEALENNPEYEKRSPSWFKWGERPKLEDSVFSHKVFSHIDISTGDSVFIDVYVYDIPTSVFTNPGDKAFYLDGTFSKQNVNGRDTFQLKYDNLIQTSVISPCFDLSSTNRPMLTMKSIHSMDQADGVVVQYTTDVGKPLSQVKWLNIGEYETDKLNNHLQTGIHWYNAENIFGAPGKQSDNQGKIGFTNVSTVDSLTDTTGLNFIPAWYESRNDLDLVREVPYVRFRFAMGSNSEVAKDGYIFDDLSITEREKNIVFETFTNNSKDFFKDMNKHDTSIAGKSLDILDIQYHTAFPQADPINKVNTDDPSARASYYGISQTSYLQGDGNKFSDLISSDNYNEFTLKARALEDLKFTLNMSYSPASKQIEVKINPHDADFLTNAVDVNLQIALVEKEVILGSNVHAAFNNYPAKNVLRELIPNAAGTNFNDLFKGDPRTVTYSVDFSNFTANVDSFKIIAFVQDRKTKEIYQANWVDALKTSTYPPTGQEEYEQIVADGVEYNLYPNPTTGVTHMSFNNALHDDYVLSIYNQVGVLVTSETIRAGVNQHSFDIQHMTPGMYFIMLNNGEKNVAIKKLMLTK